MTEILAAVIDTETTGIDEPQVVEFAAAPVTAAKGPTFTMGETSVLRFKPTKPIALGAMATHHIVPADLDDCPPPPERYDLPKFMIGHNADFDWQAVGSPEDVRRIDTMWLARMAWPDLDSHSLGALTYHLYPHTEARELLKNAHSAAADIALCFHVFCCALLTIQAPEPLTSWGAIWRLSEAARVPIRMAFGKHKGVLIADLPRDYVDWMMRPEQPGGPPKADAYLIQAFRNAGLLPQENAA